MLLGFAGALRRAELVGIDREHLAFRGTGLHLVIPRSKADPEGEGTEIAIPRGAERETCPVRALEAWLLESDCQYGPVFRKVDLWGNVEERRLHPDAVRQILLRRAKQAGVQAPPGERLSPHGLRAGFVAEAYRAGVRDEQIMAHTRHADLKTMRGYGRRGRRTEDAPAKPGR
jgi:integrase